MKKNRDYIATLEGMLDNLNRINRELEALNDPSYIDSKVTEIFGDTPAPTIDLDAILTKCGF